MSRESVKVYVRVRPVQDENELSIVEVINGKTLKIGASLEGQRVNGSGGAGPSIENLDGIVRPITTSVWDFDKVFDVSTSQRQVFNEIGADMMENMLTGYNCTVFAYGQTGAGKTHTMVGSKSSPGLIPRLVKALYDRTNETASSGSPVEYKIEASLVEVYNENLRDLFKDAAASSPTLMAFQTPSTRYSSNNSSSSTVGTESATTTATTAVGSNPSSNLRVREHPLSGPYVEGLTGWAPETYVEMLQLVEAGFRARVTAATVSNEVSSRSHAIFTLTLHQRTVDGLSGLHFDRVSKFNLVDLAGSERASKTSGKKERFKETREINGSLLAIGRVINTLAEGRSRHVPYRDSVITWLLKESLGGNSKTVMIASVHSAAACYEESLSSLRYASRAKRIVNVAQVNEDANERIIAELRAELDLLRRQLAEGGGGSPPPSLASLSSSSASVSSLASTPSGGPLSKNGGVSPSSSSTRQASGGEKDDNGSGDEERGAACHPAVVELSRTTPYMVNIAPAVKARSPILVHLEASVTVGSSPSATVILPSLLPLHAEIHTRFDNDDSARAGVSSVLRVCAGATVTVNGELVTGFRVLSDGELVVFGGLYVYWFREVGGAGHPREGKDGVFIGATPTAALLGALAKGDADTGAVYAASFPHPPSSAWEDEEGGSHKHRSESALLENIADEESDGDIDDFEDEEERLERKRRQYERVKAATTGGSSSSAASTTAASAAVTRLATPKSHVSRSATAGDSGPLPLSPPSAFEVVKREKESLRRQLAACQSMNQKSERELNYSLEEYSRLKVRCDRELAKMSAKMAQLESELEAAKGSSQGSAVGAPSRPDREKALRRSQAETDDHGSEGDEGTQQDEEREDDLLSHDEEPQRTHSRREKDSEGAAVSRSKSGGGGARALHTALSDMGIHVPLPVLESLSPQVWCV